MLLGEGHAAAPLVVAAERQATEAEKEADDLRRARDWAPGSADFHELQRRVAGMEEQHRRREREWQGALEEARSVHALQAQLAQQKWQLMLESKDAQIERFRR